MQGRKIMILILIAVLLIAIAAFVFALSQKQQQDQANNNQANNVSRESNQQTTEKQQESTKKENKEQENPASKAPKAEDLKSLDGIVKSTGENSLTVEFQYEDTTWQSEVQINEKTFVGKPAQDDNSAPQTATPQEIQPEDKVIVSSQDNIFNKDTFPASGIMVVK
jgi:type II secretory pathway pseudopilin PulG